MRYILKFNPFKMNLINESIKDKYLNYLLDKISDGNKINKDQTDFLNNFKDINDKYIKDYTYTTHFNTYLTIMDLLNNNTQILYKIKDNMDDFDQKINNISRDVDDKIYITLNNGNKKEIKDNFLYNLNFNIDTFEYSLSQQDEYFEKIPLKND